MPLSAILWGTAYENVLTFGYPLYDRLTDREERAGSEHQIGASGTEDSWITGRDYTLMVSAKFVPEAPVPGGVSGSPVVPGGGATRSGWSAAMGYQDFLDYVRQGFPFRFVPDATNPAFYLDGCYLVDPKSPGPGTLGEDLNRVVPLKIRNPLYDFSRALRGIAFEYSPGGGLPTGWTFSRAGLAYYFGSDGKLRTAQANVLRENDPPDVPALVGVTALLEAAATNLDENNDYETDVVGLNGNGGATITRDSNPLGTSPRSGAWCARCDIPNTGGAGFFKLTRANNRFPVVANGVYVASHYVYVPPGSGLVGQNVNVNLEWWSLTSGGVQVSVVTSLQTIKAGWNRYSVVGTVPASGVAAAGPSWYLASAPGAAYSVWTELNQLERQDAIQMPTSPIVSSTVGGTTRNAETISAPWTTVPLASWVYRKWIERSASQAVQNTWAITPSSSFTAHLWRGLRHSSGSYYADHEAVAGTVVDTTALAPTVNYGDTVEAVYGLYADGSVDLRLRVNGGADLYSGRTAALIGGLQDKWGDAANTAIILAVSAPLGATGADELITFKLGLGAPPASVAAAAAL